MTTSVSPRTSGTLNPTRQQLDELDALLQRMLELPVHPLDKPEETRSVERSSAIGSPLADNGERTADSGQRPTKPPLSYTVVETASPRPLPPADFESRRSMLKPRLVPVTPPPEAPAASPVPEADESETWVPLRSTWQPSASTWPPLAESWHQANGAAPPLAPSIPIADPRPDPMPPPLAKPEPTDETTAPLPTSERSLETPSSEIKTPDEPRRSPLGEDAPVSATWPLLPLVWFNEGFDACFALLGAPGRWLCGRGRVVLGFLGLACLAAAFAIAINAGMGWSR